MKSAHQLMLRVRAVPGEATRFWVESGSLECPACRKLFNKRTKAGLRVGDRCPNLACDKGRLDVRFHEVDISDFNFNGRCSCEHFVFTLWPKVSRQAPDDQAMGRHRCSHIDAARDFALDVTLRGHELSRMALAGGQREEDQP